MVPSWDHTLEGFRYLRTNTRIATALALMAVLSLGGWAYQSQLSAFVVSQLHQGVKVYGWLFAMNGLGACIAAFFVAAQGARIINARTLWGGAGLYAISIILFGFMTHPLAAAVPLFFAGFGIILCFSVGNSIVQTQSPDHLRGRLMGIWALVFGGGMPLGSLWMGLIAQHTTSGFALQLGGGFCAVGAVGVYVAMRSKSGRLGGVKK